MSGWASWNPEIDITKDHREDHRSQCAVRRKIFKIAIVATSVRSHRCLLLGAYHHVQSGLVQLRHRLQAHVLIVRTRPVSRQRLPKAARWSFPDPVPEEQGKTHTPPDFPTDLGRDSGTELPFHSIISACALWATSFGKLGWIQMCFFQYSFHRLHLMSHFLDAHQHHKE